MYNFWKSSFCNKFHCLTTPNFPFSANLLSNVTTVCSSGLAVQAVGGFKPPFKTSLKHLTITNMITSVYSPNGCEEIVRNHQIEYEKSLQLCLLNLWTMWSVSSVQKHIHIYNGHPQRISLFILVCRRFVFKLGYHIQGQSLMIHIRNYRGPQRYKLVLY